MKRTAPVPVTNMLKYWVHILDQWWNHLGWERERKEVWWDQTMDDHCSGDGQKDDDCGEMGREMMRRCACGTWKWCCWLWWQWSAGDGESEVESIFLLALGPPNSKTTIQQDGAPNPITGDTWFPVALACEGRQGCTSVLEELQWFLSQQAPQRVEADHMVSQKHTYACEQKNRAKQAFATRRAGNVVSVSEHRGGEAKMKVTGFC